MMDFFLFFYIFLVFCFSFTKIKLENLKFSSFILFGTPIAHVFYLRSFSFESTMSTEGKYFPSGENESEIENAIAKNSWRRCCAHDPVRNRLRFIHFMFLQQRHRELFLSPSWRQRNLRTFIFCTPSSISKPLFKPENFIEFVSWPI